MAEQNQLSLNNPDHSQERTTLFVDVLLPLSLAKPFTYRVPESLKEEALPGKRVIVQFGKKKIFTALVYQVHETPPEAYTAKYLLSILDETPIVHDEQLTFWQWMANYYCAPIGNVMDAALPANLKLESETKLKLNPQATYDEQELDEREYLVIEALEAQEILNLSDLEAILNRKTVFPVIKSMHEKGLIELEEQLSSGYKPKKAAFVTLGEAYRVDGRPEKEVYDMLEKAPKQMDLFMAYQVLRKSEHHISKKALLEKAQATNNTLKALEEKGILTVYEKDVERLEWDEPEPVDFELTADQQSAFEQIKDQFRDQHAVLLHGVTSSGKTHIYMKLIEETIANGQQALYLVPEISLTAQLIRRLRNYFGDQIGIYHSKLNANERVEIWYNILNERYKVVLGVRSALFLPFRDLGLTVIDEEHEGTFKQNDPAPRYNARDAAVYMAYLFNSNALLGTGTPSLESYFNAKSGKYGLVHLKNRYGDIKMPEIQVTDLREEYRKNKMKSDFSSQLYSEIQKKLSNNKQILLFQNRRGYSPFIQCQTCGWVPECRNCDVSLTYHKFFKEIRCHLCGYHEENPSICRACGSTELKMKGIGTEKIEDELKTLLPDTNTLRLDQDTTQRKNAYQQIISEFEKGNAQILVGTQMVTKGLDFENVKLVGIVSADQMLKYPDFRANERSFQLMMQVSGRAGRKNEPGKVVIQTFMAEHNIFFYLQNHDFEGFYQQELSERSQFHYPPFYRLIKLTLKDQSLDKIKDGGQVLANRLSHHFGNRVLGPEMPPVIRVKNRYITNILLKFGKKDVNLGQAKKTMMHEVANFSSETDYKSIRVNVDVDPV